MAIELILWGLELEQKNLEDKHDIYNQRLNFIDKLISNYESSIDEIKIKSNILNDLLDQYKKKIDSADILISNSKLLMELSNDEFKLELEKILK